MAINWFNDGSPLARSSTPQSRFHEIVEAMEAQFEASWPSLSTVERQHALTREPHHMHGILFDFMEPARELSLFPGSICRRCARNQVFIGSAAFVAPSARLRAGQAPQAHRAGCKQDPPVFSEPGGGP